MDEKKMPMADTIKEVMEIRKLSPMSDPGQYIRNEVALKRELDSANKLIKLMVENSSDPNVKEVFDYMIICARDISFRELLEENKKLKDEITSLQTKLSRFERIKELVLDIYDELY